jgi:uncharacterized membrane protein
VPTTDEGDVDARLGEYRAHAISRQQDRVRQNVALAACVLDLCALGLIAGQAHGPVRQVFGLACCLLVPGWAIVGPLRLHHAALEASLAVATSLASLLVVAQIAITFGIWHLTAIDVVVSLACLPSLVWQAAGRRWLGAPR